MSENPELYVSAAKTSAFDMETVIFYIEEGMSEFARLREFDADFFADGCQALFQSIVVAQALAANNGGLPFPDKDGISWFLTDEANKLLWAIAFFRYPGQIKTPANWPFSAEEMKEDYAKVYGDLHMPQKYEFPWASSRIITSEVFKK